MRVGHFLLPSLFRTIQAYDSRVTQLVRYQYSTDVRNDVLRAHPTALHWGN